MEDSSMNYRDLTVVQLKEMCKSRGLKVSGKKAELEMRLSEYDESSQRPNILLNRTMNHVQRMQTQPEDSPYNNISTGAYHGANGEACDFNEVHSNPIDSDSTNTESMPIDAEKLGQDVVALEDFFQQGLGISSDNDGDGDAEEIAEENPVDQEMVEEALSTIKNPNALEALKWVDQFILETRRKGGRQTEESVLKQWQLATVALAGFPVGETYYVPWAQVEVPTHLQQQIFPFCEDAISRLRAAGYSNQGTYNFLELLQNLRPFFWRAISAINQRFPDSPLATRLRILTKNTAAKSFMEQWPDLCAKEEAANDQTAILRQGFSETPTQNAFSTLSAQVKSIQTEVSVIKRRTEQFSPSKPQGLSQLSHFPLPGQSLLPAPSFLDRLSRPSPTVLSVPDQLLPANSYISSPIQSELPTGSCTQSRAQASLSNLGAEQALCSVPADVEPNAPSSSFPDRVARPLNLLVPERIAGPKNTIYNVLRLVGPTSPAHGQLSATHTSYDKILPPPTAFSHQTYPSFTTVDCTWNYMFKAVSNPSMLWESYAPDSLGDYPTVMALWEAWDEGIYVIGIGRKPALRTIEERWGSLKNKETNKGTFPSWRPKNNPSARKIWAKFYFFISRIEGRINAGQSSDEAVKYFDDLRQQGNMTVNQLYTSLQEKRGTKRKLPTSEEGAEGQVIDQ